MFLEADELGTHTFVHVAELYVILFSWQSFSRVDYCTTVLYEYQVDGLYVQ